MSTHVDTDTVGLSARSTIRVYCGQFYRQFPAPGQGKASVFTADDVVYNGNKLATWAGDDGFLTIVDTTTHTYSGNSSNSVNRYRVTHAGWTLIKEYRRRRDLLPCGHRGHLTTEAGYECLVDWCDTVHTRADLREVDYLD